MVSLTLFLTIVGVQALMNCLILNPFDINGALLDMKVGVGPESVAHVRTGQQLSDIQSRLKYTVFYDFHSRQHSGKFVEIFLV